jgi:hypothetical protein
MIKITHDLNRLVKHLNAIEKQLPFATAKTLTVIARRVRDDLGAEMNTRFNRPTPYISKSAFSTVATKTKPEAVVGIRDQASRGASPAQYIKEHFGGGLRGNKPFELLLSRGGVLPEGWKAIPAAGLKLDKYGNPSRNQLKEILGSLRSRVRVLAGRGGRTSRGYFVVQPGARVRISAHLKPGVWLRTERGSKSVIIPVFIFVRSASYRNSIDLRRIAATVIEQEFSAVLMSELINALGSNRK